MRALTKENVMAADAVLSSVLEAALRSASVRDGELTSLLWRRCDALYEVIFSTDWVLYDTFVDPKSLEVLGMSTMPTETI